jgi:hypothetical protein
MRTGKPKLRKEGKKKKKREREKAERGGKEWGRIGTVRILVAFGGTSQTFDILLRHKDSGLGLVMLRVGSRL